MVEIRNFNVNMEEEHFCSCAIYLVIPVPDLSHLVPFHSGQVENFHLLVLGQVKMH